MKLKRPIAERREIAPVLVASVLDLCIAALCASIALQVVRTTSYAWASGLPAILVWFYSVWILCAIPRCLFAIGYVWITRSVPYSSSFACVAMLLDAGFVLLPILTRTPY